MEWCHCYLHSFLLCQLGLCCPASFLYALTGWCWHRNCSSLMFYTKSSVRQVIWVGRPPWMQSRAHHIHFDTTICFLRDSQPLWWEECCWTPVRHYTARETSAFKKFWIALIVIGINWGWTEICKYVSKKHVFGLMHKNYISPLYLSTPKDFKQLCSSGVEIFQKGVHSTSHITYHISHTTYHISHITYHKSHITYIYTLYIYI